MYILDASVGIKWFLPEIYSVKAHHLLETVFYFEVPDLFFIEMDSIITKKVRQGKIEASKAVEITKTLRKQSFTITNYNTINDIVLHIATAYFISLYDAVYVTLAVVKDKQMITADRKLVGAVKNTSLKNYVRFIGDLEI